MSAAKISKIASQFGGVEWVVQWREPPQASQNLTQPFVKLIAVMPFHAESINRWAMVKIMKIAYGIYMAHEKFHS